MSTIQKEIKRYFDEPPHNTEKVTDIIKAIQEDFGLVAAMVGYIMGVEYIKPLKQKK